MIKCNLHFLQITIINIRFTSLIGKNLLFNDHNREVKYVVTNNSNKNNMVSQCDVGIFRVFF